MQALRNLFGWGTRARRATPARRSTVKLRMEALEDRTVPSTIANAVDGTVYAIWGNDRELWHRETNGQWQHVLNMNTGDYINNVQHVAAGQDGSIDYVQTTNGSAVIYQANQYYYNDNALAPTAMVDQYKVSNNVIALAAGQNGEIYVAWQYYHRQYYPSYHYVNRQDLYVYRGAGDQGQWLDSNVADVSVGGYGQVYTVYTSGELDERDANYDSSSQSQLLSAGVGVHHVAGAEGWNYYITCGSNNQLWESTWDGSNGQQWHNQFYTPDGWQSFTNVAQISAKWSDYNPGVTFLTTDYTLWHMGSDYYFHEQSNGFALS
jgi:hypothetical protein